MVVEDEPDIYEILMAMFDIWGIDGIAFVDGEGAVSWIDDVDSGRFSGELPELALLDIRLPGDIEGPDVGRRIRESDQLGHMAIVLITAWKLSAEEERAIIARSGADKLIYKPLPKFDELQTVLENIIVDRRARQANAAKGNPPIASG